MEKSTCNTEYTFNPDTKKFFFVLLNLFSLSFKYARLYLFMKL